jgi:BA14K-like protein
MHRLKILTAAAALLVATPVVAQEMGGGSLGPDPLYADGYGYGYDDGYYGGYYDNYQRNDFWPGRVAGDIVGGAIGTADAIATAPFRALNGNPSYAMGPDISYCAQRYRSYDPASGTFMGYDGRRHPCQ